MPNRLDELFQQGAAENRALLMPYLTAGFPTVESFTEIACALFEAGADALEVGIPFSDPLLDGTAIQRSQQIALENGVTPLEAIRLAAQLRDNGHGPVVLMGAYNPLFACGLKRFVEKAAGAGVSGLIVPDLPFEEQRDLNQAASEHDIHLIQMVAPTSTDERLRNILAAAQGFIYCVSVAGVTGARENVSAAARPLVERVRGFSSLPVAVGFGIATPEHAGEVGEFADAVIVGAALINLVARAPVEARVTEAANFIRSLRNALDRAAVS